MGEGGGAGAGEGEDGAGGGGAGGVGSGESADGGEPLGGAGEAAAAEKRSAPRLLGFGEPQNRPVSSDMTKTMILGHLFKSSAEFSLFEPATCFPMAFRLNFENPDASTSQKLPPSALFTAIAIAPNMNPSIGKRRICGGLAVGWAAQEWGSLKGSLTFLEKYNFIIGRLIIKLCMKTK